MAITYKNVEYSREQINYMREWAKDCTWKEDNDNSFIDDLSDLDILKGIERNFEGGLPEALACLTPVLLPSS